MPRHRKNPTNRRKLYCHNKGGLCISGQRFQRIMHKIYSGMVNNYLMIYLDDLLIYSLNFEAHLKHLREVFIRLSDANLRVKMSKCQLLKEQLERAWHQTQNFVTLSLQKTDHGHRGKAVHRPCSVFPTFHPRLQHYRETIT